MNQNSSRRARFSSHSRLLPLLLLLLVVSSHGVTSTIVLTEEDNHTTTTTSKKEKNVYTFALVPKSVDNPFFDLARDGCMDQAKILEERHYHQDTIIKGVECLYVGPPADANDVDGNIQAQMVQDLLDQGAIDGLAVSVKQVDAMEPVIQRAVQEARIPVVTFDSDAPDSLRSAYIGTDNYFFGIQLGKVLKQLKPNGGTYATIGDHSPNIAERVRGFQYEMSQEDGRRQQDENKSERKKRSKKNKDNDNANGSSDFLWHELPKSPSNFQSNISLAMDQMEQFATENEGNVTAIVPVMGAPMRSGRWVDFVRKHRKTQNITLVSGDAMANQLAMLNRGYVHGLLGQLPYDMGMKAIEILHSLLLEQKEQQQKQTTSSNTTGSIPAKMDKEIQGTNVLTHILVPLELPELVVDHNLIGDLNVVGYILFALVAVTAIGFSWWTWKFRKVRVVQAAQPSFLIMVAVGVLLLASCLVPLSFDDKGNPNSQTDAQGAMICMSVPWVGFLGFTTSFSALFAKTLRVNRLFHAKVRFAKTKVTSKDVLIPFAVLLTLNIVILTLWTLLDPLIYVRENRPGLDGWNRIIETYGTCQSRHVARYLAPLAVLNIGVLALANWQAYEARLIESEFSESKYIGLANGFFLQAAISGVPVLFIVRDSPQAFYLVLVFTIFVISMSVLVLIFVPKMILGETHRRRSDLDQQRHLRQSIRNSQSKIDRSGGWLQTGELSSEPLPGGSGGASGPFSPRRRQRVQQQHYQNHEMSMNSAAEAVQQFDQAQHMNRPVGDVMELPSSSSSPPPTQREYDAEQGFTTTSDEQSHSTGRRRSGEHACSSSNSSSNFPHYSSTSTERTMVRSGASPPSNNNDIAATEIEGTASTSSVVDVDNEDTVEAAPSSAAESSRQSAVVLGSDETSA